VGTLAYGHLNVYVPYCARCYLYRYYPGTNSVDFKESRPCEA
jgi:hypothetical protein